MISSERLREYGFIASFYFVVVGVLYLWGYWYSFEVNILEYISLTDIVKVTLIPIISSFLAFASGAVLGAFLDPTKNLPAGAGADTTMGKFLNKYKSWLLGLYWANIFIIYYFGPVQKWLFLTALVAIFFQTILANQGFLQDLISHDGIRRITVLLLCALPFYAYGHGVISADNIINGRSHKYLEFNTSKFTNLAGSNNKDEQYKNFKFLGFMNNYVFLMPVEEKTVIVAKFDSIEPIALKTYSKRD